MQINQMAEKAFMEYSMEVLKQRALPSVEDGCKPIHRRILYGMKDGGYTSSKPTRKSAKIVGEILGRFHPHGDSSVYDAMIRLAQPWKMRYPLVEVQGNMGNILGDKQAASRYTEARLTPIGELMTKDINKNCVPMSLNYSGEEEEPDILTSEFPNSLVNPNLGIAVGMSSTTVPHNLNEVCDALVAYIRGEGALTTKGLLQYVKGPDFPTGGTIINGEDIPKIYEDGRGSIKLRAKYRVEVINNKPTIIITEVPYLISIEDKIINKIKAMVIEEDYQGIENVQNHTGNSGFEIRVICSRNANVNKVIKDLCDKTGFQTSININNTVLVNGIPKFIPFIEMIKYYVEFRHNVIIKCAKFDKVKTEARLHILEGLLIALADIDNVIAIIKSSTNKSDARIKLIEKYKFSVEQANAILDMKLSKLTSLEIEEIKEEKVELEKQIIQLNAIINNTNKARDIMLINQIIAIKNKFGDARRTTITSIQEQTENVETKEVIHLVLNNNTLLPLEPQDKVNLAKKGSPFAKQQIKFGYKTTNTGISYLFDVEGRIHKIDNILFDLNAANPLTIGSELVCGLDKLTKQYLITVTTNGIVKKTKIEEYAKITGRPTQAVKIRDGDKLAYAGCANDNDYLFILGTEGGLIKCAVSSLSTTGRITIGSKGIDDEVLSAAIAADDDLLFTFASGKAKFSYGKDFNITAKGGKGQTITEGTTAIAAINDYIYVVENNTKLTQYTTKSLSIKGKSAIGAKISNEQFVKVIN